LLTTTVLAWVVATSAAAVGGAFAPAGAAAPLADGLAEPTGSGALGELGVVPGSRDGAVLHPGSHRVGDLDPGYLVSVVGDPGICVPEPGSTVLLGVGVAAIAYGWQRRQR
jgi:hypothetical protein